MNSPKRGGLSGKQAAGVVLLATVILALMVLNYNLYNSIQSQGSALTQMTAELEALKNRLSELAPLGELANVTKPPTAIVSEYTMMFNYNRDSVLDDRDSIIVFYAPVEGSTARLELFVDSLSKYELDLTLQEGNAWRNETWAKLGTVNQVYNLNLSTTKGSSIVWQSSIVWSLKVTDTGVYETPPMSKGWHTLSMFGPITILDNGDFYRYPMFHGASDVPHAVVKLDSYRVVITFTVQKDGERHFFAVTNERS